MRDFLTLVESPRSILLIVRRKAAKLFFRVSVVLFSVQRRQHEHLSDVDVVCVLQVVFANDEVHIVVIAIVFSSDATQVVAHADGVGSGDRFFLLLWLFHRVFCLVQRL